MADPVDLEALDELFRGASTRYLAEALIRAYPALREEIVSLREEVADLRVHGLSGVDHLVAERDEAREHLRRVVQASRSVMDESVGAPLASTHRVMGALAAALAAVPPELLEEPRDG